ncbi:hematopoietic cell signal transducer [Hypomesus transpacificus]|uniref:hematopoietic cell signal transducer n=1 Tax=Hypomesus transpacificus TaxID=137520 RepID=UPI001F08846B|nr:hematopoietic cell signal transducer [Hypomesus transpacificus]
MVYHILLLFLTLCFCEVTVAGEETNVSCYRIEPSTMAGIIIADVILTLAIVLVTYHCASRRREGKAEADKIYMNVRANCKT